MAVKWPMPDVAPRSNTFDLGEYRPLIRFIYFVQSKQTAVTEANDVFTKADGLILTAAFLSFLFSVSLWFGVGISASKETGIFVGLWVPSILAAGNYFRQAARAQRDV